MNKSVAIATTICLIAFVVFVGVHSQEYGGHGGYETSNSYGGGGSGYYDNSYEKEEERPKIKLNIGLHIPAMKIQVPRMNMPKITIKAKIRQPNRPTTLFVPEIQLDKTSGIPGPEGSKPADDKSKSYSTNDYSQQQSYGGQKSYGSQQNYGSSPNYGAPESYEASQSSYGNGNNYQQSSLPAVGHSYSNDNYQGSGPGYLAASPYQPSHGGQESANNNNYQQQAPQIYQQKPSYDRYSAAPSQPIVTHYNGDSHPSTLNYQQMRQYPTAQQYNNQFGYGNH